MPAAKNVLLIVVDQWRGLMLPKLGADYLKLPNLDRLCAEGVTFRNHFTQTRALRAGAGQPADQPLLMNHRAVQNTIPLDARFTNLATSCAAAATTRPWSATPRPRPIRARPPPNDPRFLVLGDIMDGFHPVGAFETRKDAYFGWVASQGFKLPETREDIWLPEGDRPASGHGATARPSRIPKELSDTAWFTERGLDLPARPRRQAVVPASRLLPPAPALHRAGALSRDVPARGHAQGGARAHRRPRRRSRIALLAYYVNNIKQASFFQDGKALGSAMSEQQVAQMRATYCGLMSEIDDQLGRVFDYPEADRPVGRHADRLHLRSRRAAGRPSPAGQDRLFRRVLSHPDDRARSARRGQRHARHDRRALHRDDRHHADHPRMARPADPAPVRRPLAAAASAKASRPRTGAPRCITSSTSATSTTASPRSALGVPMDKCSLAVVQDERLQVRALRRAAAAVLRSQEGPRPVRQPRRRSGLCRASRRVRRRRCSTGAWASPTAPSPATAPRPTASRCARPDASGSCFPDRGALSSRGSLARSHTRMWMRLSGQTPALC